MIKESKLEKIGKEESQLKETLKTAGFFYSVLLGLPTLGALGGLAYSLYTGDNAMLKDIGAGAIGGGVTELIGLFCASLYGGKDCGFW